MQYQNEVILAGELATGPEIRMFGTGVTRAHLLVTVRLKDRADVIPVTVWEPDNSVRDATPKTPIKVFAQIHRRFWTDAEGRHSRFEVVAQQIEIG